MVIVQGVFTVNPDERQAFLAQSFETMEVSRAEKGCLEYVMAADPIDDGRVILSERWETKADLDAHISALMERRKTAPADPSAIAPLTREVAFFSASEIDR